ncbi:hypothetical protein Q8F55_005154 [Vanrija albida]|uniref:Conserved oligomeric Golgi complex subunit 7 n=1 Tax=Vanrija albida TaxID=181172 RepID=A0ABR3Q1H4_9TREE
MANNTTPGATPPAVVDLSDPPLDGAVSPTGGAPDPLSSLGALATTLDSYYDDVPAFVNSILAQHLEPPLGAGQKALPPKLPPIEKQLNELLTRLSLLSQDTSSSLEQTIHDVSRTVPRLTYDLQFMRESAVSLQSGLQLVQDRVARQTKPGSAAAETDEAKTHRALDKLAHLDKLKTRMESARDILREAESWSTLEGEITSFVQDKEWTKAAERLAEASRSLVVFQSAEGEYESKRALLVSLQNELEAALSTALKDAIAQVDTEACAGFYDIFRMMDRGQEFQNYYFAARRAPITEAWASATLSDTGAATRQSVDLRASFEPRQSSERPSLDLDRRSGPDEPLNFADWLPKFYAVVLATLNAERQQIPLIFPATSAGAILQAFFQSALDELSPSFHSRLTSVSEHHGPEALPQVIRAYKATEDLAVAVQDVVDKLAFNTQGGLLSGAGPLSPTSHSPNSPLTPKSARTPNQRLSVSHRFSRSFSVGEAVPSHPSGWETAVFEPFLDLQTDYPALESRYLAHLLKIDIAFIDAAKDDPARTLTDRAIAVFSLGEDAISRCLAFTHGYGAIGLVAALNDMVERFLKDNAGIFEAARKAARRGAGAPDELDFEGLDYSTEDWGAFQLALHVLQSCRGIRDRLSAFEGKLFVALESITPTLNLSPADPTAFTRTDTTLGAITLLQQSVLNSADLHALISSITPPVYELTRTRAAVSQHTQKAQVFLQSIILSPLQAQLESYPTLSVWNQPDKAPRRGELHVPTFSLSPTDTIARVSEGLLNLLRVFEVYADDDALAFSIETLPFIDTESLRELLHPEKPATPDVLDKVVDKGAAATAPTPPVLSAEAVLSTWVSSLALSLLSHLTKSTLPAIKVLSNPGAAQLASDLGYLSNAVRALDVEWDDLERWREATECKDEAEWRDKVGSERKGVLVAIGKLRGWVL